MPDFPSELVEAAAKALAGEPRCYCPDDWRADPSPRCPFHGDGEWPTYAHYLQARAVLAAVLPLIRSSDEPGPFEPGYADVVRRAARSADAPQETNPYRNGGAREWDPYPHASDVWEEAFAAGRSAERARLAEIDVMAFGKATCARFTYAEDQPYEAVGDRDSLRLRAFLDAYLRAALSEGTPDKEDTDA